jgi:predicted phosphodiesterase
MTYQYKHFTPQNIAPKGAKRIGVYDSNGEKVSSIPLGGLTPPNTEKLYSFGLVSDIHLYKKNASWVDWNPNPKFDNALTHFENEGCDMCIVCGDLTQTGFYDEGLVFNAEQLAVYKEICDKHTIPVYEIAGNHESYYEQPITKNLDKWKEYTGNDLYYKVEHQNDVFIFCGQSAGSIPMSDEAFTFLSETLSANSNKRCFVFVHPVWNDDSGDAGGVYSNHSGLGGTLLSSWSKGNALKTLLKQYPKAVLFHGHTHIKFEEQTKDKNLNYTNRNGFHSIHIPSLSRPRDIVDNALVYAPTQSQGYIVDVYEDCIVLNGMDFINNKFVPLGVYKIDIMGEVKA